MIEAQLRNHLIGRTELVGHLATYANQLAVFNQEAPADTDPGWGTGSQYGRIVFYLNMADDPERKISGTLGVDVYCESGQQAPEELEPIVRELIDGWFFSNEDITMAANWSASNYFTDPTQKAIGVTINFNMLAFPSHETIDPDPVALINQWSVDELTEVLERNIDAEAFIVIGTDSIPEAWQPSALVPAIYWRLGNIDKCGWIPDTFNCSWQTATLHGHVMASDRQTEAKMARLIQNTLQIKKRLIFEDEAPLMIDRNIKITSTNDPLRNGQISLEGTYGILNILPEGTKITEIHMS